MRPAGAARDIVVFGHGWSTPEPGGAFRGWIDHLRRGGSIVVYPRYEATPADSPAAALAAFRAGVVAALRRLRPIGVPILALGKSYGGSAVFYYAAGAGSWGVPGPAAVVSIFPAYPIGAPPPTALPRSTYVRVLVGDADTIAGSGGADAFWRWLAGHPRRLETYDVIHSRPGFVADHDSAQRTDAAARAVFWAPVDALLARLVRRHGRY
jgi:hypothetical protein